MSARRTPVLVGLLALAFAAAALAQEEPSVTKGGRGEAGAQRDPRVATSTLRVQLVITRTQNDKKQASLPYAFLVGAYPVNTLPRQNAVRMRMGVDTPLLGVEDGKQKINYRTVGTNIDCWATDLGAGTYQLNLSVENSSALPGAGGKDDATGAPLFRRFDTSMNPVLRDGQTVQTVASTDPVSGEVVKIDLTINVVK